MTAEPLSPEVAVGQVYADNDPRSPGRQGTVVEVDTVRGRARITWHRSKRTTWVAFGRLRSNGKTGYTLVDGAVTAEPLSAEQARDFAQRWAWWRRHELECPLDDVEAWEMWLRDNGPAERLLPKFDRGRLFAWVRRELSLSHGDRAIGRRIRVLADRLGLTYEHADELRRAGGWPDFDPSDDEPCEHPEHDREVDEDGQTYCTNCDEDLPGQGWHVLDGEPSLVFEHPGHGRLMVRGWQWDEPQEVAEITGEWGGKLLGLGDDPPDPRAQVTPRQLAEAIGNAMHTVEGMWRAWDGLTPEQRASALDRWEQALIDAG